MDMGILKIVVFTDICGYNIQLIRMLNLYCAI